MLEHNGIRWGYVFLKASSYLGTDEFQDLMVQAVEMFLAGETERNVKGPEYEGRLYTEQRYELLVPWAANVSTPIWRPPAAMTTHHSW